MPPPARRPPLNEQQILKITDSLLERPRRSRRRSWRWVLLAPSVLTISAAAIIGYRTPAAQLAPLALSAPALLAAAIF